MRIFDNFPSDRRERDAPIPRNKIRLVTSLYYIARDNIFEREGKNRKLQSGEERKKKMEGGKLVKISFLFSSTSVDERKNSR